MSGESKKTLFTPFNVIAGIILAAGVVLTIMRFTQGIGAVSNLDDNNPWGIWIGFDLLCGVALAAGGYTTSAACYLFGNKRFHAGVRPAILTAFLGYALVVFALHYDVGQPWRLVYPIFYQQGTTSLLFEVGLCVFLYLTVLFIEFMPAPLEWLGQRNLRNLAHSLTLVLTIFGVVLSTLHQSSLGALYLIAPAKLHPLWYTPYLPLYFWFSSIFAGLSMVIFEGTLSHKYLHNMMDKGYNDSYEGLQLAFAKAASWIMAGYFIIKVIGVAVDNEWGLLFKDGYGTLFLIEMLGFVALPSYLYAVGARDKNMKLIRWTSFVAVLGIVFNRFNVSILAFNYHLDAADRYFPSIEEVGITVFIVTLGVVIFRFITTRMPVFYEHPDYKEEH